ncbi:TIGR04282 family arsenosugar biosynthesis glycosyltransferase [Ulvibacter litoralis]|uniref:DUF2064 domain-containing protein n=1 Tax=Ulvibacter litoralis TaxID=227084 RepID=A0A1G7CGS0_9FLAO|nr:DUF2064 domain-containing protein [Ulvibacter litoralis]GHC47404.1 hypothetical protein GCM10008083_08260 [Ulvibacter litoralis]SDE38537.1 hypothetical protein SAMN05421855_101369 [Ulvibacter litoralis]
MNSKKTAILIFAQSAQREGTLKPFKQSVVLFEELNKQTLRKVEKSGLPYFLFSEKEQVGNTFAKRYTNAIEAIYQKGFENIITIGNDTPHLQTKQLTETAKTLEQNPIVLGPSTDGGYYLMGLKKSHFNPSDFLKLPWGTSSLTRVISKLFSAKKTRIVFLKVLQDIDAVSDIKKILNSFKYIAVSLIKLLHSILSSEKTVLTKNSLFLENLLHQSYFNKGSPVFLQVQV